MPDEDMLVYEDHEMLDEKKKRCVLHHIHGY